MKPVLYTEGARMRIAVDAHAVGRKQTGNETYIRNLLREFALADTDAQFLAYISAPEAECVLPSSFEVRRVSQNPFQRLGLDLPSRLREDQPDVVHVQYTSPLSCPTPVVVTVHDVSFLERPHYFSYFRRTQLRTTVRRTIQRASRIIAPSEFSKERILAWYGLPEDRVTVIHNGVDPQFRPMPRESAARLVFQRHGIAAPYVLTVGDLQMRKNQSGLIEAFAGLMREMPGLKHHLVLVGKENWHGSAVKEAAMRSGLGERIHLTGFVSDEELRNLYGGCDVFVFPSFYEGFGLPILEAMACGRAVACSDSSAMPEVADSAALLFSPESKTEMGRAIRDLLIDDGLRQRIERLGQQRASSFSWQKAARETLRVYETVAEHRDLPRAARVSA
jgi:glycosyltransferase involved in cell wall biosynthesis